MNGSLKLLTARKILPLLDLLAKFKQVLACLCHLHLPLYLQTKPQSIFVIPRKIQRIHYSFNNMPTAEKEMHHSKYAISHAVDLLGTSAIFQR